MFTETAEVRPGVFPFVSFTNTDGKMFVIHRDRIIHTETYQCPPGSPTEEAELDHKMTFVNFSSPNHKSKGALHAVVGMSVEDFRDKVMRPAYEGSRES